MLSKMLTVAFCNLQRTVIWLNEEYRTATQLRMDVMMGTHCWDLQRGGADLIGNGLGNRHYASVSIYTCGPTFDICNYFCVIHLFQSYPFGYFVACLS